MFGASEQKKILISLPKKSFKFLISSVLESGVFLYSPFVLKLPFFSPLPYKNTAVRKVLLSAELSLVLGAL